MSEEFLRLLTGGKEIPRISHDGVIARLRDYAERFNAARTFATGDIVTPVPGGLFLAEMQGRPFIVLRMIDEMLDEQKNPCNMQIVSYSHKQDACQVILAHSADWELLSDFLARRAASTESLTETT